MSQSHSIVSVREHDRCLEKSEKYDVLKTIKAINPNGPIWYTHDRPLPWATARRALRYISAITAKYPFQLRYAMMLPLWYRFTESWCDTGSEGAAMSHI